MRNYNQIAPSTSTARLLDGRPVFRGAGGRLPIRHGLGGFAINPFICNCPERGFRRLGLICAKPRKRIERENILGTFHLAQTAGFCAARRRLSAKFKAVFAFWRQKHGCFFLVARARIIFCAKPRKNGNSRSVITTKTQGGWTYNIQQGGRQEETIDNSRPQAIPLVTAGASAMVRSVCDLLCLHNTLSLLDDLFEPVAKEEPRRNRDRKVSVRLLVRKEPLR